MFEGTGFPNDVGSSVGSCWQREGMVEAGVTRGAIKGPAALGRSGESNAVVRVML